MMIDFKIQNVYRQEETKDKSINKKTITPHCNYYNHFPRSKTCRRKIRPHHTDFVCKLITDNPNITRKELLYELNKAFPGLNIALSTLQAYIRNALPDQNETLKRQLRKQQKVAQTIELGDAHIEFIKEKLRTDDKFTIAKIHQQLQRAYPSFKIGKVTLWKHIRETLRTEYNSFKERKLNRTEHFYK